MSALELVMMKRVGELNAEVKLLKAEVEVQNQRIDRRDEDVGRLYFENTRLKAEVERLRKLGTEMGKHLPDTDEANRAYIDFEAGGRS